ncbi:MAG: 3'-5' exonuclease [Candidatus Margulisbacteria bacterium]|nr:3'-5' exonuclease [Candidatus Margulisiibacteriota bacterium]
MLVDLLKDQQFQQLEKEYKFLARARGATLDDLEFVIVDIETTGLEPALFEMTEIAAMKVAGKELKDIYSSLIKPKYPIPVEITRLTGIDAETVKDAPAAESVLKRFVEFAKDAVLVAHNSEFDIPFIKHHLKKNLNLELTNQTICTVKLARRFLPQLANHKLHTVAAHFGINIQNRHRAMGDVELTFQVWEHFLPILKDQGIANKAQLDAFIARL